MNNKKLIIVAASLLILSSIAVKPAMAYFTDSHSGKGTVAMTMEMGDYKIVPDEEVDGMIKKITVKNEGDYPVRARVKVFAGSTHEIDFVSEESASWSTNSDGFYYYDEELEPNASSSQLVVQVNPNGEPTGTFNVIVVEEATRVQGDGTYDWKEKIEYTQETQAEVAPQTETTDEGGAN